MDLWLTIRWSFTAIIVIPAGMIIFANWFRYIWMYRYAARTGKRRFISGSPLIGPLLLTLALFIAPLGAMHDRMPYAWLPWIIDEQTWVIAYALLFFTILRPIFGWDPRSNPPWKRNPTPSR
jgi:integral membrane sensor domain MASE1